MTLTAKNRLKLYPILNILLLISFLTPFQPHLHVSAQQSDLHFYVISCEDCPGYRARVQILEETYPQGKVTFYGIEEGDNAERFKRIGDTLNETLYMPLVGVFVNEDLKAITSGGLSADDWRIAVEGPAEGVNVYVADIKGHMDVKAVIRDPEKLATLTRLFTESDIGKIPIRNNVLQLLFLVTAAAVADAINPCCFSVFVILLTFVFYGVGKKAVLKVGLAFTSGLFITYFMMGLGLSRFFQYIPEVKYLITILAFAFGSLRVFEALGVKVKHVPSAFASRISTRIERVSNPKNGFVAGIVTGSLLLPCSSAPYFIVLSLLSERASQLTGLALLGFYNIIIILPFVIITLVVHGLTLSTMQLKLWSMENRRWVNLVMGVVLISLGIVNLLR